MHLHCCYILDVMNYSVFALCTMHWHFAWCFIVVLQLLRTAIKSVLQCDCPIGKPKEEVVEAVHEHLRSVAAAMDAGEVPLNQFIITKQLTKRPEDYPDAKNQPHVQVRR